MKISIIMHGVSGSGKSTRSKELIEEYNNKVNNLTYSIHSTDSLFIENGVYKFRPEKLQEYHSINYKNFVESINNNTMIVIVDNTNIFPKHWKPYEEAAEKMNYKVEHCWMPIIDPETAFSRNIHGVPMFSIERQIENYKKFYPI